MLKVRLMGTKNDIVYDLNNLKRVNDTFGHIVGDQFILNFSNLLRNTIPAQDLK